MLNRRIANLFLKYLDTIDCVVCFEVVIFLPYQVLIDLLAHLGGDGRRCFVSQLRLVLLLCLEQICYFALGYRDPLIVFI